MKTNLQKIKELLSNSRLSLQEQEELIILFSRTRDSDLEPVAKLFFENPDWIEKISKNYQSKQKAVTSQNLNDWQKIIQEEESLLKELEG